MKSSNAVTKILAMVLCAISLTACATPSQMYWDHKVKELCEKDGGVTVYEHIELTPDEFKKFGGDKYGQIPIPGENSSAANKSEYLSRSVETEINHLDPHVRRMEYVIYRKSDKKDLGKMVNYSRSGGDLLVVDAGTNFTCADMKTIRLDIEKQIFTIKGETK